MKYLLSVICMFFILTSAGNSGVFFNHPRDGKFKMLSTSNDPWFYVDKVNWTFKNPDKWQHYMGNYVAAVLMKKKAGYIPTAAILTTANTVKELEDGYREGASFRDLAVGTLGMLAGIFQTNLICEYDSEKIMLMYYLSF